MNIFFSKDYSNFYIYVDVDLKRAMTKRELEELEKAINAVKKHGLEVPLAKELGEATKLLTRLKRLERIRHEILELKQATVAEIRSYQNPPPVVHKVMTATFLLLGHQEKETKVLYSIGLFTAYIIIMSSLLFASYKCKC